jgi:hypothetical protein
MNSVEALMCFTSGRRIEKNHYFEDGLVTDLWASACGLRKVVLTGADGLFAFGFLASRLPRCLLPLPIGDPLTCDGSLTAGKRAAA